MPAVPLPPVLACLMLLTLTACAGGGERAYFAPSRLGRDVAQPMPAGHRAELIAFMRTYLNDPSGVREAGITEPFLKDVGGLRRYVVCLRYDARDFNGRYTGAVEKAALFLDGRFDQILERTGDVCAGQAYAAFPDLERLTLPR